MSYGWPDKPTKAPVKHHIGGDEPSTVYEIGKYEVTVPGDELPVTYKCPYYSRGTDPRQTFPNMEVSDGEVRLPVEDLVSVILSRLDPVELAQELWRNDEVRRAFMDALATRYSERGIDDAARREFLRAVQATVHSRAVDDLVCKMAAVEHAIAREANHYAEISRINEALKAHGVMTSRTIWKDGEPQGREEILLQFDERQRTPGSHTGELAFGGKCWTEARDYWRAEALRLFPIPPEESPESPADGDEVL